MKTPATRTARTLLTLDGFFDGAQQMRDAFDDRFKDPRGANADRFIWDYWHVPGQYTALRTPAYHFFTKKLYDAFHQQLVWWGRRNLGCHDVSPPWMSCYIEGCKQELHGDLPHGPWAFVYSLTPWRQRRFQGGETVLLREHILNYWQSVHSTRGLEQDDVLQTVPALFNRLTIFDPRIPHGVREVRGVHDVLEGRLVMHGWFVQPRPFIEGALSPRELQGFIDDLSGSLQALLEQGLEMNGLMSVRFSISKKGEAQDVQLLTNGLRHPHGDARIEKALVRHVKKEIEKASFKKQRAISNVTLPLIFS